jgi:hypothetical protein
MYFTHNVWKNQIVFCRKNRLTFFLESLPAVGAIEKVGCEHPPAVMAFSSYLRRILFPRCSIFFETHSAVPTDKKWNASLERKEGNEKKAQIMVHPLQGQFHTSTGRTGSDLSVHTDRSGLGSADEEKHFNSLLNHGWKHGKTVLLLHDTSL